MSIIKLLKFNLFSSTIIIVFILLSSAIIGAADNLLTPSGNALKQQNLYSFVSIMLISTLMSISGGIIKYIANYLYMNQQQKYIHQVRKGIIQYYWQKSNLINNAQNRLTNDINIVSQNLLDPYFKIVSCGLDIIVSAFFVYSYNQFLLILIVVLAAVILILPKLLSKPVKKATYIMSHSNNMYLNTIADWFSGLTVLQRYKRKNTFEKVLSQGSDKLENSVINLNKKTTEINSINYAVNILAQGIILAVTGILIVKNIVEFGVFFSIGNFASTIFTNLVVVANNLTLLNSSSEVNDEIKKQLKLTVDKKVKFDSDVIDINTITFDGVSLQVNSTEKICYPDIKINKGEKILLLGDSGTGKSTLLKLILGIYHPTSGEIIFKDSNNKVIRPDLSKIGYIPQDPVLFPGTVEDNITLFNKKLVKEADYWAKNLDLTADLNKFPQGIKSRINLNNNTYSGGQRQKIVLARTKVYDSKVILIDEGTSAIDSQSTLRILKKILNTDATIIFIAHNLSQQVSKLFDREIVLK